MLKNYLQIAWRNIRKNKFFSFINIVGFATGLTCFTLIAVFVFNELNYDKYPAQAKNIYRVNLSVTGNGSVAVYPNVDVAVGEGIRKAFPEVKASTRLTPHIDFVKFNNRQFKEVHLAFADGNFLQFFSIPLVAGAPNALAEPNSIVVARSFATKYFGQENPIGKTILLGTQGTPYKVTGLIDKVPDNSHFHFDAFLSLSTIRRTTFTWSNIGYYTYVLLNPGADPRKLQAKFPGLVEKFVVPEIQHDMGVSLAEAKKSVNTFVFSLEPLSRIHLYSNTKFELEPNGDIQYVYIFSALAFFILLLACVNFTNLSTARAIKRAKEVGIRKVLGSLRRQLVLQFLTESVLFTLFSMLCTYLLIYLLLPYFNQLANTRFTFSIFYAFPSWVLLLTVSVITGLLAGAYPAFFLSSLNSIEVLKGSSPQGGQRRGLRSGLIVFQFFVSTALIIATTIVYQQLNFMQNRKLGYDKEQVLFVPDTRLLGANQAAFKQQVLQDNHVVSASLSPSVPGSSFMDGSEIYPKNNNTNGIEIHANIYYVDYDYLKTLGISLAKGRNFSPGFADSSAVVINEAAVKELGWTPDNAIGKTIVRSGQVEYKVIGIAKDFNYASLKQKIAPLLMMLGHNSGGLLVKIRTTGVKDFLAALKQTWNSFRPSGPIEYHFIDEQFDKIYASEKHTQQIFSAFTVLAVIIASLGLFGLSAFIIDQRKKEISIRKVLGASVRGVLLLVARQFLLLVILAFLIAVPVTWWAMKKWLDDFAYRVTISWWMFLAAGVIALVIALLTISFQAIKAAVANPVKSLRTE